MVFLPPKFHQVLRSKLFGDEEFDDDLPEKYEDYHVDLLAQVLDYFEDGFSYKKEPVLFIDEAHKLKDIIKTPGDEGDKAMQLFLDWIVKLQNKTLEFKL